MAPTEPSATGASATSTRCPGCFSDTGGASPCPRCGFDPSVPGPVSALTPGTVLHEQFVIGRVLGKPGGFGITYLALDRALATRVAIKEYLPRDLAVRAADGLTIAPHSTEDADTFRFGLSQFLEEARTLARLDHPNIVRVRQFFSAHGSAYLVMDYYQGLSLAEYLARQLDGRLPEAKALGLMQPILDGLRAVHAEGFLHRDIKPANIYLARTQSGGARPILLDFGAARQSVGERSRSLSVLVTDGYAPFEQYSRKGRQGPWTDVYAAAAVLYRVLTGQTPPPAPERIDEDELKPASDFGISQPLSDALALALAVRPEGRPQTVEAWQRQLLRQAAPAGSEPVTRLEPLPADTAAPSRQGPDAVTPKARPAPRPVTTYAPRRAAPAMDSRLLGWAIALGLLVLMFAGVAALLPTVPPQSMPPAMSYTLRVVNRPGEYSGIWRTAVGSSARRHYVIVEALDSGGKPVLLTITNEETGRTERVNKFGLRVDEQTFQRVAADKRDDNIIQNDILGYKAPDARTLTYTVPTTGAAITSW
jgi:serine/threonine protein kinase